MYSRYADISFKELYATYDEAIAAERIRKPWLYPAEDKSAKKVIVYAPAKQQTPAPEQVQLFAADLSPMVVNRLVNPRTKADNKLVVSIHQLEDDEKITKYRIELWPTYREQRLGGPEGKELVTDIYCLGRLPGDSEDRWILMSLYPCYFNAAVMRHSAPPEL